MARGLFKFVVVLEFAIGQAALLEFIFTVFPRLHGYGLNLKHPR